MSAFEPVLDALLRASLYGGLFIAAVWAVCRLFPRLPAGMRCGLWWAACLKLLLDLVWIAPVPLALLPAETTAGPAVQAATLYIRNVEAVPSRALTPNQLIPPGPDPSLPPSPGEGRSLSWESALVAIWFLGLFVLSVRMILGLRQTRRILRSAEPLRDSWVRTAFLELCARLSLRRAPELRGSGEVGTPQVTGLLRPVVLIPESGLARLTPAEMSMTLCHELVHLRRRDLWLGWVPALAQRLFFFHPLAALAAREYALAREAACDAEVIHVLGSAPQAYGRLLLRWGVAPRETGLAAAGASPSAQNLKRRLQMLQQTSDSRKRSALWWWLAGAAVLVGMVPIQIVAQEREDAPQAEEAVEAVAPLAPVDAVEPVLADAPEAELAEPAEIAAPVEAVEPVEPVEPLSETPEPVEPLSGLPAVAQAPTPLPPPPGVPVPARAPRAPKAVSPVPPARLAPGTPAPPAAYAAPVVGAPAPAAGAHPTPGVHPTPGAHPVPGVAPVPGAPVPARAPKAAPGRHPRPALAPVPSAPPVARAYGTPAPAPRAAGAREYQGVTPPPPAPPRPPKPPVPPKPPKEGKHGYSYSYNDNGNSWIILKGENNTIMNGSTRDIEKVRQLRKGGEDIFWFRRDGKAYVVRDAATLAQVEKIWEPIGELGAKQGELGAQQGALGGKQGALGAKQGALGAQQGTLAAERVRRGSEADEREIEKRQREIEKDMDQLSREMEDLGGEMEALGRQMEDLGRRMEAASAKAEKDMQALMAQAIRSGVAQEVR
ncbi:MAG TPA: M56 family metallopeptidase [Thermoanaerobaculia bacterium]